MYPFIHIGPLTLGTYGLMVASGLLCAFFIMRADIVRRGLNADAESIIGITGLAGLAGARIYHLAESPSEFFADPWHLLFSTSGFAWFGALIGGFIALVLLARRYKMSMLLMLDIASPAAALGYGVGRIGCLLSGDGDYGIPTKLPWGMSFPNGLVPTTGPWDPESHSGVCSKFGLPQNCAVHPTPIYEFLAALIIAHFLWRIGRWALNPRRPAGDVFGWYLIATGVVRFLVEFIRLNDRSFLGMSNAQAASVVSVVAGVILLVSLPRGQAEPEPVARKKHKPVPRPSHQPAR
jgi:phosphatidylglycerol---prolipoprotein diacylglyceryl transferase